MTEHTSEGHCEAYLSTWDRAWQCAMKGGGSCKEMVSGGRKALKFFEFMKKKVGEEDEMGK